MFYFFFWEYRHCQSFSNDVIEALTEVLEKNLNLNDEIVDVHEESAKSNENRKRKLKFVLSSFFVSLFLFPTLGV